MAKVVPFKAPVPTALSVADALKVIREIAADSSRVILGKHASKRGRQRAINRRQIDVCLRRGLIEEGPFMNMHGHWQVTMCRRAAGDEIHCVVAIDWATRLIVITVY